MGTGKLKKGTDGVIHVFSATLTSSVLEEAAYTKTCIRREGKLPSEIKEALKIPQGRYKHQGKGWRNREAASVRIYLEILCKPLTVCSIQRILIHSKS